ncbi:gamma-glutamylcyclotransferase family protein [Romboutsia hominis]|uniref:AIG2-like family n=1 Tax=Romboutsia hominis TaxID=1507512 RepID=A0A2P2BTC0_9FIRM|nr:gamma-glutamylcyclotransferase family protein [Romboutsia hominis]CEI73572.1 AIG2-like family [Romboutsia hominis]
MKKKLVGILVASSMMLMVGCSAKESNKTEAEEIKKVFIYGSLRSDMFNYDIYLDGKVTKNDKATIKGDLSHIENKGYPAVTPGNGEVIGELMEFKDFDSTLKELDELEAYEVGKENENEYNREIVDVKLEDGTTEKAYYYEYNPPAEYNKDDKLVPVKHGDWKVYMEENNKK